MASSFDVRRHKYCVFLLLLLSFCIPCGAEEASFNRCKARVHAILDGQPDPEGDLTKETLQKYLYTGPVKNLDHDYPREQYVTLTLEGKLGVFDPVILMLTVTLMARMQRSLQQPR